MMIPYLKLRRIIMENLKQKWANQIASWKASGMSIRAWCQKQGISPSTFSYWKRGREKVQDSSNKSPSPFIELKDENVKDSGVTLSVKEVEVRLSISFDSTSLQRCLNVLRRL